MKGWASEMAPEDRSILKTIDRALVLLQAFTIEKREWGVTELSNHLGWDRSIVQRVLATLEARNFVNQNQETKKYRLGLEFLSLAEVVSRTLDIREVAKSTMQKLVQETDESTILTVVRGKEAVCVEAIDSPSPIKYSTHVGMRIPLHVGAGSKVLFAFRSEDELQLILDEQTLEHFTSSTITNKEDLLEEFRNIRERGIAISLGELDSEVGAIGIPIRNYSGEVVAAITIVGPQNRIVNKIGYLEERLREVERDLEQQLTGGS